MIYVQLFSYGTFRLKEQMRPVSNIRDDYGILNLPESQISKTWTEKQDNVLEATHFLRSGDEYVLDTIWTPPYTTAILATCKSINEEVTPVFVKVAEVHWSIRAELNLAINALGEKLPWLRHLSIDFSFLRNFTADDFSHPFAAWFRRQKAKVQRDSGHDFNHDTERSENEIAECLDFVATHCRCLDTFTLHLLSDTCGTCCNVDHINNALLRHMRPSNPVGQALARIHVRDMIAIIAFDSSCQDYPMPFGPYNDILDPIADDPETACKRGSGKEGPNHVPTETTGSRPQWSLMKLRAWPGISLSHLQKAAISDLYDSASSKEGIKIWFFKPATSRELQMPQNIKPSRRQGDCEYKCGNEKIQLEWEENNMKDTYTDGQEDSDYAETEIVDWWN